MNNLTRKESDLSGRSLAEKVSDPVRSVLATAFLVREELIIETPDAHVLLEELRKESKALPATPQSIVSSVLDRLENFAKKTDRKFSLSDI